MSGVVSAVKKKRKHGKTERDGKIELLLFLICRLSAAALEKNLSRNLKVRRNVLCSFQQLIYSLLLSSTVCYVTDSVEAVLL